MRVYDTDLREKLLNQIIEEGLNVGKAEELIEKTVIKTESYLPRRKTGYKNIHSFYSAIERAVEGVKNSGVNIISRRIENDEFVELTILIPKEKELSENVI